ncbi:MAG: tetratricopeptide repeat protein [Desulfobacterales bacterium]
MKHWNFLIGPIPFLGLAILSGGCVLSGAVGNPGGTPRLQIEREATPGNNYYLYVESLLKQRQGRGDEALRLLRHAAGSDPDSSYLQRELALWLWQAGDADGARAILESGVTRHATDSRLLILLGRLQQRQDQIAAAKESFEQALDLDPDREEIYHLLGEIYLEEDQLDAAKKIYQILVRKFPESYVGSFYLGRIHSAQNNLEDAAQAFARTLDLVPDLEEPRLELAEVYTKLGRWMEAQELYQSILEEDPDHLRARLGMGMVLQEMDEDQPSQLLFKRVARQCDADPEVLKSIFQQFWDREQFEAGLDVFNLLSPYLKRTRDHHYWQGLLLEAVDSLDQAIREFQTVDPASQYFEKAVVHAAYLLQETERITQAVDFLESVIARVSDNPEFYLYLAGLHEETQNYEAALETVNKGLILDNANARLHFRQGVVADKLGRKAETIAAMETVIGLDPQNATALNYLGYTYADLGKNLDQAEYYIREALKYKPDDGYITDSLGWVYYQRGEYDQALKILLKASELAPDDPVILEHVGDAYLKISDRDNALRFYRRSLEKKSDERDLLRRKIQQILKNNG